MQLNSLQFNENGRPSGRPFYVCSNGLSLGGNLGLVGHPCGLGFDHGVEDDGQFSDASSEGFFFSQAVW
jgi:hypothetical protein